VIDIEADGVVGRVIKVSPLVTVIQELGMSGPNGTYTSFPNKRIFETPVKNFSKMNSWIYISFDFYLSTHSSFKKVKTLLMQVMTEITTKNEFKSAQSQKNFLKKFGHAEASIIPQVFLEAKPQ
jgi:small-conductance mechanosensitive channel